MKVSHLFSCLAAGLALAACRDSGPTFVTQEPQAYVRFVNASPDSPNVTARFVDKVENMFTWDRLGFRGQSGNYIAVNAGPRNLRVFMSGQGNSTTIDSASTVLLDTTGIQLQPQTYYTMVMTGRVLPRRGTAPNNARVTVFTDTLPVATAIAANQINVRVYNVSDVGPVDVTVTSNAAGAATAATIANVPVLGRSAYVAVPALASPALYTFGVRNAGAALFSATPNVAGQAFAAASVSGPALDPVAGVQQGRSVLSLFVFPAGIAGTPTASVTTRGVDLVPDQAPPRP